MFFSQEITSSIVLIGMPGVGKTTLGKALADALQRPFYDSDRLVEMECGCSARELAYAKGRDALVSMERTVLKKLPKDELFVLATGGGTIIDPISVKLLQSVGTLIYLKNSLETIQRQLFKNGKPAFLSGLDPEKELKELFEKRKPIYEKLADQEIEVEKLWEVIDSVNTSV